MGNRLRLSCILTVAVGLGFATLASASKSMRGAVEARDLARVQALLRQDPSLANSKDTTGRTPLLAAAAERGDPVQLAQLLISYGGEVNAKDNHGETPLHFACLAGNVAIAKLLISKGADLNAADSEGSTPLDKAILFNHSQLAGLLVTEGALESIFNASALGDTPLGCYEAPPSCRPSAGGRYGKPRHFFSCRRRAERAGG
jgi:ankyrin repeat protein